MHLPPDNPPPEIFNRIIDDAVSHIIEDADPQRFINWFEHRFTDYYGPQGDLFGEPDELKPLANALGRALWNAVPLPGNGFQPSPLPTPGRYEPCPCGSGKKFKHCCGGGPKPPKLDSQVLWPVVLQKLPAELRRQAIATGNAPIDALMGLADECLAAGRPKKGLQFLEPLFDGKVRRCDEDHDYALNLLCNLYDDLGYKKKKTALLTRIMAEVKRSPLRSGAGQRLAAMRMDAGEPEQAWETFRAAQRDDPKSASLGILEVQLLLGEGRSAQARERARFWVAQLRRQGFANDEGPVAFLSAVARDPEQAMAEVGMEIAGGAGKRLVAWLANVARRSLPDYGVSNEPPGLSVDAAEDPEAATAQHLRQMGVPEQQIALAVASMQAQMASLDVEPVPDEAAPSDTCYLIAPSSLAEIEAHWQEIFPLGKPFSISEEAMADDDAWDPRNEASWMAFLEAHPEAYDSLDVLDDLATAVIDHPQSDIPGLDETLLEPLLRRAHSIIDRALTETDSPKLEWSSMANRPVLRSLVRLIYLEQRLSNFDAADGLAQQVLSLNPNDNHGLRTMVMNSLLRQGKNERAVNLADQYPDDLHPDLPYGKALALFCQSRHEEAQTALQDAVRCMPKVVRFLTAKRVRQPKIDPAGVRIGGEDQAWLYRQEMRDVWAATPGALEWLKKASKTRE